MRDKPVIYCFAAYVYADGRIWGDVHRVSLETADWMRGLGYVIVGPDPENLCDLARWEREHWNERQ
jgi:hypothetical protein